jgi:hypothetical protein
MQQEFSAAYCKLPNDWVGRQLQHATAEMPSNSRFKPREIYIARTKDEILAMALCLPKRGGGTKILLATRTSHIDSLLQIISRIETDTKRSGKNIRKLYSLVPTLDSILQKAFYQTGFHSEGVLDRPYRTSDDLMVFSKMI